MSRSFPASNSCAIQFTESSMTFPFPPPDRFTALSLRIRGKSRKIDEIELDPARETSVICSAVCSRNEVESPPCPKLVRYRHLRSRTGSARRGLLIGDQAIRFRQQHGPEFHFGTWANNGNGLLIFHSFTPSGSFGRKLPMPESSLTRCARCASEFSEHRQVDRRRGRVRSRVLRALLPGTSAV